MARIEGALALQGFWHLSSVGKLPLPDEYSSEKLKQYTTRILGGYTYDEMDALGAMIIGSPEQVAERVDVLEKMGIDTLLLVASFGNLSHEQVCRSLELFAEAAIKPRRTGSRVSSAEQAKHGHHAAVVGARKK